MGAVRVSAHPNPVQITNMLLLHHAQVCAQIAKARANAACSQAEMQELQWELSVSLRKASECFDEFNRGIEVAATISMFDFGGSFGMMQLLCLFVLLDKFNRGIEVAATISNFDLVGHFK